MDAIFLAFIDLVLMITRKCVACFRKRKCSTSSTPSAKKSHVTDTEAGASDEEQDDKDSVRKSLVIKLPGKQKKSSNVIVIDDSSNDSDSSSESQAETADIKPDTMQLRLNQASLNTSTRTEVNDVELCSNSGVNKTSPKSVNISTKRRTKSIGSVAKNVPVVEEQHATKYPKWFSSAGPRSDSKSCGGTSSQRSNVVENDDNQQSTSSSVVATPKPKRSSVANGNCASREFGTQTDADSSDALQTLQTLRTNVLKLLKTIVPTLDDFGNLEFVDTVVVEMVRVSDVTDTSQNSAVNDDDVKS